MLGFVLKPNSIDFSSYRHSSDQFGFGVFNIECVSGMVLEPEAVILPRTASGNPIINPILYVMLRALKKKPKYLLLQLQVINKVRYLS